MSLPGDSHFGRRRSNAGSHADGSPAMKSRNFAIDRGLALGGGVRRSIGEIEEQSSETSRLAGAARGRNLHQRRRKVIGQWYVSRFNRPQSSTRSIRRLGWPTFFPGLQRRRGAGSANSYLGTGCPTAARAPPNCGPRRRVILPHESERRHLITQQERDRRLAIGPDLTIVGTIDEAGSGGSKLRIRGARTSVVFGRRGRSGGFQSCDRG
jgi:hypothetical protein